MTLIQSDNSESKKENAKKKPGGAATARNVFLLYTMDCGCVSESEKKIFIGRRHSIIAGKEDVVDAWSDYIGDCGPCPYDYRGNHDWKETGKTRPGRIFGDSWPDEEVKCTRCGKTGWNMG